MKQNNVMSHCWNDHCLKTKAEGKISGFNQRWTLDGFFKDVQMHFIEVEQQIKHSTADIKKCHTTSHVMKVNRSHILSKVPHNAVKLTLMKLDRTIAFQMLQNQDSHPNTVVIICPSSTSSARITAQAIKKCRSHETCCCPKEKAWAWSKTRRVKKDERAAGTGKWAGRNHCKSKCTGNFWGQGTALQFLMGWAPI